MTNLVILSYPLVAALFFQMMPFRHAVAATVVVGYVILPPLREISLPGLPNLGKSSMPVFAALLLAPIFVNARARSASVAPRGQSEPSLVPLAGWLPKNPLVRSCLVVLALIPIATYATNTQPVIDVNRFSQALRPYDIVVMMNVLLGTCVPFVIARRYLHDDASHRAILLVLAIVGLVLSLATLFEIRMSPRLNIMVYGYFPHDWRQHLRSGGFRPVVFFSHALQLAVFLCMAAIAVIAYFRATEGERRALFFIAAIFLIVVLFLSRSFGIALIAAVFVPLAFILPLRAMVGFAAFCGLFVTLYPAMNALGFNPLSALLPVLEVLRPDRVHSYAFRLEEGRQILEHVAGKPLFGWGIYSRWEATDPRGGTGTVPDAMWLLILPRYGWLGYFAFYGLIFLPLLLLWKSSKVQAPSAAIAGLALVLAANAVDLIPNSSVTPITLMLAGAIMGYVDRVQQGVPDPLARQVPVETEIHAAARAAPARSRFGPQVAAVSATARNAAEDATSAAPPEAKSESRFTRFSTQPRHRRV